MKYLWLIPYYISWHYTRAYRELWHACLNIFHFLFDFFSINLLFRTFFAPFERLNEKYKGGLDAKNFLSTLFINIMMRLVGALMRSVIIISGIVTMLISVLVGALIIVAWAFIPFVLGLVLLFGVAGLLNIRLSAS